MDAPGTGGFPNPGGGGGGGGAPEAGGGGGGGGGFPLAMFGGGGGTLFNFFCDGGESGGWSLLDFLSLPVFPSIAMGILIDFSGGGFRMTFSLLAHSGFGSGLGGSGKSGGGSGFVLRKFGLRHGTSIST